MTRQREGELYALILSILESWFPILSLFAIQAIGALNTYFFVLVIATAVLMIVLGTKEGYGGLVSKAALPDLLWTSFYITTLFTLIFLGLRYTTAGNMAVILTLQLLFSYLYFNLIGSEKMDALHTFAAFLMPSRRWRTTTKNAPARTSVPSPFLRSGTLRHCPFFSWGRC